MEPCDSLGPPPGLLPRIRLYSSSAESLRQDTGTERLDAGFERRGGLLVAVGIQYLEESLFNRSLRRQIDERINRVVVGRVVACSHSLIIRRPRFDGDVYAARELSAQLHRVT